MVSISLLILNLLLAVTFFLILILNRLSRIQLLNICFLSSLGCFISSLILGFEFFLSNSSDSIPVFWYEFDWFFTLPAILYIDSVSLCLIMLTTILFPCCFFYSWFNIKYRLRDFLLILISIEFFLIQVFSIVDLFFFYIVFEAILIPMFLLIGIWGSRRRRIHAAYQFFFYTACGSFFMLLALVFIYSRVGSLDWRLIIEHTFCWDEELILWLAFFFAFAIKVPLFPFHIWLPEAHVEAPTVGSVILAGVLLKMGTYGLYRFNLCLFPFATMVFTPYVQVLCLLGIFYTSLSTLRQVDLKKIIAYASVGHMSYVVLGLFSLNLWGIGGSIYLMLGHGVVSSALFFLIGSLYERCHTRLLPFFGGLNLVMPFFSFFFFLFTLGNMSFPGTVNFIGEFLCVAGAFMSNWVCGSLAIFAILLTAAYSIWLFNRLCCGQLMTPCVIKFSSVDLTFREISVMSFLTGLLFFFGIKPDVILHLIEMTVNCYIWQFSVSWWWGWGVV